MFKGRAPAFLTLDFHRYQFSFRRLQQFAIAISALSVVYNGAEAGLSMGFGAESSRSLIFFGIQSGIKVISSALVLWRFGKVAKPGDERGVTLRPEELKYVCIHVCFFNSDERFYFTNRFEKFGTLGIGSLLILLMLGTEATSIATLIMHQQPDSSNASLIISATSLVLMIFIWLPKRYLAIALNSSVMQGEAICSLSCIQLTFILFVGSVLAKVWKAGWWVDAATSIVLGLLFGWEGLKMVRWAGSKAFGGGCCKNHGIAPPVDVRTDTEMGEIHIDLCKCCQEKEDCKSSDGCKCSSVPVQIGQTTEAKVSTTLFFSVPHLFTTPTEQLF
jgi:hypothetical protein